MNGCLKAEVIDQVTARWLAGDNTEQRQNTYQGQNPEHRTKAEHINNYLNSNHYLLVMTLSGICAENEIQV